MTPGEPGDTDPGLRSDGELEDALVGELEPHNAPITLAEYNLGWPGLFAREAGRIQAALGDAAT
jgi:GrpB-like predicted nucleotidyltransferase (UPF0157 family)